MRTFLRLSVVVAALSFASATQAQAPTFGQMQNMIPRDQRAINQFDVKKDSVEFKGLSIDLGGAFALQFQAMNSFNDQQGGTYVASNGAAITNYRLNNLENNKINTIITDKLRQKLNNSFKLAKMMVCRYCINEVRFHFSF